MSELQFKVNVLNRLKKIRKGVVYESLETVIDELLQNCQRSFKSGIVDNPIIDLIIGEDYLIIRDNGIGCENPESILEFETSGWENIPGAFGQGGSESIFQITDYFEVSSLNWKICVDVEKILKTEDLSVIPDWNREFYQGYEIMIKGEKIAADIDQIRSYLEATIKRYPYSCYIDGELVEYEPMELIDSDYTETFDNKFYTATLGVRKSYRDLEIFYEKRKVTDLWFSGAMGFIELKDDAVDLKAPDRKSIIQNSKYREFRQQIEDDVKFLYLSFLSNSDYELYEKYISSIDEYLAPEDYIEYLPSYSKDIEYVRKQAFEEEVPSTKTLKQVDDIQEAVKAHNNGMEFHSGGSGFRSPEHTEIKTKCRTELKHKFKDDLKDAFNYAWVESIRKEQYAEIIQSLEEFGIKILLSKNKLYDRAFVFLKIPHVSTIAERTESRWIVGGSSTFTKNKEVTMPIKRSRDKEQRLLEVLSRVEEHYGIEDVFRIADVKEHILIQDLDRTIVDTTTKTAFAPIKDRGKIYLDRDSLNLNKLTVDKSTAAITKFDVLVVLMNSNTIANGLANILYNSINGTVAHYRYVEKISKEIAMLLASF